MEDKDILVDIGLNNVDISENIPEIDSDNINVNSIDIEPIKPKYIKISESFSTSEGMNEQLKHTLLTERDANDQHPISAITGLESRLSELESLNTKYVSGKNLANYYHWYDNNMTSEDREGLFVTFKQGTNEIIITNHDAIGVIVNAENTGFIGNESENGRDNSFGLVCSNGKVKVKVTGTINVGDRIVPSIGGYGKKSNNDYGYQVIEIYNIGNVKYAEIYLNTQAEDSVKLQDEIDVIENRLGVNESNINVAINTAQNAANTSNNNYQQLSNQMIVVEGHVQSALNLANSANSAASVAGTSAALAQAIAQSAESTIQEIQTDVENSISSSEAKINQLIENTAPLTTWTSGDNTGAEYFVEYIDDNFLRTQTEISTVSGLAEDAYNATEKNAKMIYNLATVEHKYTVGPHSPSYGLDYQGAKDLIPQDMIYVPTVNVIETMPADNKVFQFYQGNSYKWDGQTWISYPDTAAISSSYVTGNSNLIYWYVSGNDVNYNGIIYPSGSLCLWRDGNWIVVANINDYANFHATSKIYQTATEFGAEISDVKGDIVTINGKIEEGSSKIAALTTSQDLQSTAISGLISESNKNSAYIENLSQYGGDGLVSSEILNSSPTGIFYMVPPIWDETNERWYYEDGTEGITVPVSPCYRINSDDNSQYYQYVVVQNNVWIRNTHKYSDSLAAIKQEVNSNSATITQIVSAIGNDNGEVNAASIIASANQNDSYIGMDADKIGFTSGILDMTTGSFQIKAGNGFILNQNGVIWNTDNNPIKMVYARTILTKPENGKSYNEFAENDGTDAVWHRNINNQDKYASETSDSGRTWSAVRKIVGEDGTSVSIKGIATSATQVTGQTYYVLSINGTQIADAELGNGYVYNGHLYVCTTVNSGADYFTDVGQIKGEPGAAGADGRSLYATYHDEFEDGDEVTYPPIGGIGEGWHLEMTADSVWVSQKIANAINDSTVEWGAPIRLKGETGVGIYSVIEEYIQTNNKEIAPSASDTRWSENAPQWIEGHYIWHRTKIIYTDPNKDPEYTSPYCDTSWEAANLVQQNLNQTNAALVKTNDGLKSLVANMSTYNVGKFSPSYYMSYDDAILLISNGASYVPTVDHSENLIRDEILDQVTTDSANGAVLSAGTLQDRENNFDVVSLKSPPFDALDVTTMKTFHFESDDNSTYVYTWNGTAWVKGISVSKSTSVPTSGTLWLCPQTISDGSAILYHANTLYLNNGGNWIAVASESESDLQLSMSAIRQTASSISSTVTDIQGSFSLVEQTAHDINLIVDDNGVKAEVLINAINNNENSGSSVKINADVINLGNSVVVTPGEGITSIKGNVINTGEIDANKVTVKNLDANSITTGAIDAQKIAVVNLDANNIITGSINADRISGGTIDATRVSVTNLDASNITSGTIQSERINTDVLSIASGGAIKSYTGATTMTSTTGVAMTCESALRTHMVGVSTGGAKIAYNGNVNQSVVSVFESGAQMLSDFGARTFDVTNQIRASESITITSDREKKKDIEDLEYEDIFKKLKPVRYKMKNGDTGRYHVGFVAQDVKAAVEDSGWSTNDFAAYCEWEEEGETTCGLRYEEFVALNTHMIQKLMNKINELENEIKELKEVNNNAEI